MLLLYVKYIESKSIFFPEKKIDFTPAQIGLAFQDVYFITSDKLKINGWFFPHPRAKRTILFFHGNAGNISNRLDKIISMLRLKVNIFIIDYRGYGKSEGKPKEQGIYLDAYAAYDYLVNQQGIKPKDIIVYGESLGGAVAIDLASNKEVGAVILEGTFSSGRDVGVKLYPYLPKFILPNVLNSLTKVVKVKVPKLFIHSKQDLVIPLELGKKLYDFSPGPKKFIAVAGTHNSLFIDAESVCLKAIAAFIEQLDLNN